MRGMLKLNSISTMHYNKEVILDTLVGSEINILHLPWP